MADVETFRQCWSKFATGVSIVTTIEEDGEVHGMAANGINSVCLDPLLVLVCVGHGRTTYPLIKNTQRFAINILREDQQPIAEYYAAPPETRKGQVPVDFNFTKTGSATIDRSLGFMDCHVVDEYVAGDHTIFLGEVDEIQVNGGRPLIFFESRFARLEPDRAQDGG